MTLSLPFSAAAAVLGTALAWALAHAYRRVRPFYGDPQPRADADSLVDPYRSDKDDQPLTPYQAAWLRGRERPGQVAFASVDARGLLEEEEPLRVTAVGEPKDLDPFEQLIYDRAGSVFALWLQHSVNVAMDDRLEEGLAGSRLVAPDGGRALPWFTTIGLALGILGCAVAVVAAGRWFGLLGVLAIWFGHRAVRSRGAIPGEQISDAGKQALDTLERCHAARVTGVNPEKLTLDDIKLFVALDPRPSLQVSTLFRHLIHRPLPQVADVPSWPRIGAPLSPRARVSARRSNRRHSAVRLLAGALMLAVGVAIAASIAPPLDAATWTASACTGAAALLASLAERWRRGDYRYHLWTDGVAVLPGVQDRPPAGAGADSPPTSPRN